MDKKLISNTQKQKVDTKVWLFFWFGKYLKGKVEWKSFEEIDVQWMYLKFVIVYFREKNLSKSFYYYKKLNKKCIKFLLERHLRVYKWVENYIWYTLMKKKWDMIKFLKFWLRIFWVLEGENEKKFFYTIYTYIKKCEIQYNKGVLKEKDREMIDKIHDIFSSNSNFLPTTNGRFWIISRFDVDFLKIPMELLQKEKV